MKFRGRILEIAALGCVLIASIGAPGIPAASAAVAAPVGTAAATIPLFAYYYIWFDTDSWNRAKIDYPLIGRYSSDDAAVMRQQIEQAKSVGIEGFIVSWKNTPTDDRRLQLLMRVATQENFKLAMIYEGLDFKRNPLPVSEVAADFKLFSDVYAPNPVFFRLNGKPLTIWSGTWAYSHADVASVTSPVRNRILVLSTEKSVAGFRRIADVTDGDAYYWSSVNPATDSGYAAKLTAMSTAIHQDGKYWIAPFAPGFDARLVGGDSVVGRNGGQTLRTEYAAAVQSSPDILGLISWNEYSENTYVEPSVNYGDFYLQEVAELRGTTVPVPTSAADSSSAAGLAGHASLWPHVLLLGGFAALLMMTLGVAAHLQRRAARRGSAVSPPDQTWYSPSKDES